MKTFNVAHFEIRAAGALVRDLIMQDEDKALREVACEITGRKSRYLAIIVNAEGAEKTVSFDVLRKGGLTQAQIDKIYNVGYLSQPGKGGSTGKAKVDVSAALQAFVQS